MSQAESDEAARKRRELESSIASRVKEVQQEHERLLGLSKQVQSMEVVNDKGIEQLRQEIVKVHRDLDSESARLRSAESRLESATSTLQELQETKRALSESLMEVLLESEEAAAQRLQNVEDDLAALSAGGGGGGGGGGPETG